MDIRTIPTERLFAYKLVSYFNYPCGDFFPLNHDGVIKWKHFPRYRPFVWGIHRWPVNSPHKGQWCGALMFSLIFVLNKRLSKQSWGWWFEMPSLSLWRHCNTYIFYIYICIGVYTYKVSLTYLNVLYKFVSIRKDSSTSLAFFSLLIETLIHIKYQYMLHHHA